MKRIETTFKWVDLNQLSKQGILNGLTAALTVEPPPFENVDLILTSIDAEFVLYLELGKPFITMTARTLKAMAWVVAVNKTDTNG